MYSSLEFGQKPGESSGEFVVRHASNHPSLSDSQCGSARHPSQRPSFSGKGEMGIHIRGECENTIDRHEEQANAQHEATPIPDHVCPPCPQKLDRCLYQGQDKYL